MKYIIDTDPGVDDALAIILAIKAGLDIAAITTVAGNTIIENTTRNARYVLGLINETNVPVHSGADAPLQNNLVTAEVHGESGLGGVNPKNEPGLTDDAVEKILTIIKENEEVTLITLGPLTNVALAMQKEPETIAKLKEIIIMGGAIYEPGNVTRAAEFNIFVDPEAADHVLKSDIKKTLVPLDACNHVKMDLKDFEKLKGEQGEKIREIVSPYVSKSSIDEEGAPMYDPLTVYYALNPKAYTVNQMDVLVETKGDITRGMTIADLRNQPEQNYLLNVAQWASGEKFREDFIKNLNN